MLEPGHLLHALERKVDEFQSHHETKTAQSAQHSEWLERFSALTYLFADARLAPLDYPGAHPTREWETHQSLAVPFTQSFHNHQEAREWAASVLTARTTFAVDGSQIMPNKEISIPVAVVQAGWYLNPHEANAPFEKNVHAEVIGPEELLSSGSEEKMYHDQIISLRRYELEIDTILNFFSRTQNVKRSVTFFDGSLLISFAEVLMELYRQRYLQSALALLEASQQQAAPVIGYVDTSVARDLIRMLQFTFCDEPDLQQDGLRDAQLVQNLIPNWGDRTIAFRLSRPGILREYGDFSTELGFLYMRTKMDRLPTRIEFPLWLHESGQLDDVLDIVRAECIIGNGYPYALETADQVAWFSPFDRSRFNNLFKSFLESHSLSLQISGKLQSKQRRR
ncbi:MAG: hypothetical protein CL920_33335 [Deltaproteobacteria bacterium]|nr:hypothetical protein [Deltaproteobacteria bacterium]MBU53608.1 hypothetical protein [Deltaproteobacteria bacterium]|tara:strand:- start:10708 stop:11889 length:1182 start_codon:yes stop_codon:yes gene_type:complete